MKKSKDLLDFWSMVLKSIISSWEGTISCKIWKIKDKTQIAYFNVKTFEDFWPWKEQASELWMLLAQKIKQSGTSVPWHKECISRSTLHICDTVDEIPWWLLTNTACGKYNILKETPKFISSIPFFEGNVIFSLGQFFAALDQFLELPNCFYDLSLFSERLMSKATVKMQRRISYKSATVSKSKWNKTALQTCF